MGEAEEEAFQAGPEPDYGDIKPVPIGNTRGVINQNRLEEMSKPNKRLLLSLYESYGDHLSPEKTARIKKMLEETYSLSPEQTELYFKEMKLEIAKKKRLREIRRREHLQHKRLMVKVKKQKVKLTVIQILKECMIEAYNTPLKILMSERLRQVSDACLCQLCDILGVKVPDRDSTDNVSRLLLNFSDWIAYWIETIAYDIEAKKLDQEDDVSSVKEVEVAAK